MVKKENILNLTGKRFGKLVVLEREGRFRGCSTEWKCLCDCGKIKIVIQNNLVNKHLKSCGCYHFKFISEYRGEDLTGQKFERLLVMKFIGPHPKERSSLFLCKCDCGNEIVVRGYSLKRGDQKSCGCLRKELMPLANYKHGRSLTKEYLSAKRVKRKELHLEHDSMWTEDMDRSIRNFYSECVVCGIDREEHINSYGKDLAIDHVLPLKLGYGLKPGNAVILCQRCNSIKNSKLLTDLPEDMRTKITYAAHLFEKHWEVNA